MSSSVKLFSVSSPDALLLTPLNCLAQSSVRASSGRASQSQSHAGHAPAAVSASAACQ
uniref:Uncharacterized protein n=1 Tax=Arundo donax TaxID=35708 RepID=A0A0A9F4E3_ARUDO